MSASRRANILLVDDRPQNLLALEAALEPLDQNLVSATSGEEALKMLLKQDFAVILLDVQMPGLDGFDTAIEIKQRERTRDIPILFLTAISREPHHALRGYSTGAVDYISKPFDPWVLRAKVAVFIDLHEKNALLKKQKELLGQRLEERYRAEEALAQKAKELERSNADLQQFAYVASHDLQEPLRVITGYLEYLQGRLEKGDTGEAVEMIERIAGTAGRMDSLIQDLLQLSRIETSSQSFARVSIDDAIRQALAALEVAVQESGAEIVIRDVPTVTGDISLLAQLFQNLIGNAIKFRREGEKPKIEIASNRSDDGWLISVEDNGIGIEEGNLDRIFTVFERLNPRDSYAGSGIGLAVCKRIVERHGGRIWAESEPGRGATMRVLLSDRDA